MSFLDLDERLMTWRGAWNCARRRSPTTRRFPETDITLVEGAVANVEHLADKRVVRKRTKILVSLGDCAVTGNVTAMRNMYGLEDVLNRAYRETAAVVIGIPRGNGAVPHIGAGAAGTRGSESRPIRAGLSAFGGRDPRVSDGAAGRARDGAAGEVRINGNAS